MAGRVGEPGARQAALHSRRGERDSRSEKDSKKDSLADVDVKSLL